MDIIANDNHNICKTTSIDWDRLKNKTILITGGTGLIGSAVANALAYGNREKQLGLKIICIVRNIEKAERKLDPDIKKLVKSIEDRLEINESINYIIHAASPTASSFFVNNPVDTISIAVTSTKNLLNLAREKKVEGFVYLSSMEVYGNPKDKHMVSEKEVAGFDTMVVRNSYPQSKQICEMLCKAYHHQYGVPAKVVRLTQTFGPGVEYYDSRVFAEFARCAIEKKDIILHTLGKTERSYLYTADAATAILTVLTKGSSGEAYTAANHETYCSIIDMANMVANDIANNEIKVKCEVDNVDRGYANELHLKLDTGKLESLNWRPSVGLKEMFANMVEYLIGQKRTDYNHMQSDTKK